MQSYGSQVAGIEVPLLETASLRAYGRQED